MSDAGSLSRLPISVQIERGLLVCPGTRESLRLAGDRLEDLNGATRYRVVNGVPVLLTDSERVSRYLESQGGDMVAEYVKPSRARLREVWVHLVNRVGDMRSPESGGAFQSIFAGLTDGALCISVGGGPTRAHPALVNVNIGPFPNVDIVADAYELPYADGVVDAIHCEAVLEHLEYPDVAVREMHRVLRTGGKVFAATPFLQAFHGYPDHFQNFSLTGHVRLFERAGFSILSAGTCVGPSFAMRDLFGNYLRKCLPSTLGKSAMAIWSIATLPLLYLDRLLNRRPRSADIASTTFVLGAK